MTEFPPAKLLQALSESGVDFVLIGGVATAALGLARGTYDPDIVYRRPRYIEMIAQLESVRKSGSQ